MASDTVRNLYLRKEENDLTSSTVVETVAQWGIYWRLQRGEKKLWFAPVHPPTITHQDQTDTAKVGEESHLQARVEGLGVPRGGRTWST